ncbi:MAG TPA: hypothetical protein VL282_10860 [Tepidisphaeraceae bacterium]|jgi:hypothetical protein|nr:hypothetical protein [Tepidisphaeraceae bacterium]
MKSKSRRNQSKRSKPKDSPDAVTGAVEEGDPKVTGRSHGRIIDAQGEPPVHEVDTTDENWESGRHHAAD